MKLKSGAPSNAKPLELADKDDPSTLPVDGQVRDKRDIIQIKKTLLMIIRFSCCRNAISSVGDTQKTTTIIYVTQPRPDTHNCLSDLSMKRFCGLRVPVTTTSIM